MKEILVICFYFYSGINLIYFLIPLIDSFLNTSLDDDFLEIQYKVNNQNKNLSEKDVLINNLQNELGEYKFDNSDIQKELKILFPELKNVSFAKHLLNQNTDSTKIITVVLYQIDNKKENVDTEKIKNWLNQKLKTTNVKLIKQE